jgi:solute carrier family 25 citrate transporter 1
VRTHAAWRTHHRQCDEHRLGSGLVYTVRSTGFASLYTGLTPVLIFSVPKAGIRFGGDQYFRQQFKDAKTGKVSMASSFAAGMCAGV